MLKLCLVSKTLLHPMVALERSLDIIKHHPDNSMGEDVRKP